MENCDDQDRWFLDHEVNNVREPVEGPPPHGSCGCRKPERRFGDLIEQIEQLGGEEFPQAGPLLLIPEDGFLEIALSLRPEKEASAHSRRKR